MKKRILASLITFSLAASAQAESPFSYDAAQLSYSFTTIGVEDTDLEFSGYELTASFGKELENQWFVYVTGSAASINDDDSQNGIRFDIDATGQSVSASLGKAINLNNKADLYIMGGLAYSAIDVEMTATDTYYGDRVTFSDDGSDMSVGLEVGARLYLDSADHVELAPFLSMTSQNGDSTKLIGVNLGFSLSDRVQLLGAFSTSLDDDIDIIGAGIRIYL
ncbi:MULTISPECIES: outer membrane beta-barrel protein [unclassified Thalassolituus]|uniref:outer membrane beta-barrel protein n=1 Tax=unclassified Thalassolituus TaxID=2624967 RepID=UPI0025FF80D6|nr:MULTISPECIES: outer membrane beta-barrel protein [unclassified Thalassolituus]